MFTVLRVTLNCDGHDYSSNPIVNSAIHHPPTASTSSPSTRDSRSLFDWHCALGHIHQAAILGLAKNPALSMHIKGFKGNGIISHFPSGFNKEPKGQGLRQGVRVCPVHCSN